MLIVSAGMQKSGSAYLYNLLNGLLIAAGQADSHEIRRRHPLDGLVRGKNNHFLGQLYFGRLFALWRRTREGSFVFKTHEGPRWGLRLLQALGGARVTYIYRDPRDALLSVMDYAEKFVRNGQTDHPFARYVDFEQALAAVQDWLVTCEAYRAFPHALIVKYEDLLAAPQETLKKCEAFLGISISDEAREQLLWTHNRENPGADAKALHLNKATAFRYRTEMSPERLARCGEVLGKDLDRLGYPRN